MVENFRNKFTYRARRNDDTDKQDREARRDRLSMWADGFRI